jgi:tetratricopeptide (TPR) repeat protein
LPLRSVNPSVPRDLETVALKCLRKEPAKRYSTALELAADLTRYLNGEPVLARRVRVWERAARWMRRRPTAAALIGLLLALAVAVPVAFVLFTNQMAARREVERKRLDEGRAEILDLLARGQTATESRDWKRAELLLDQALEKIEAEPAFDWLRERIQQARHPVTERLAGLASYQQFVEDRDEALFYATLASGENLQSNRETARTKALSALAVVKLSATGKGPLALEPASSNEEKQEQREIVTGCYALLLVLAEIEARPLPQQTKKEHQKRLGQALVLLDRAQELGVRTRAIHLRRARYLSELEDEPGAARERKRERDVAAQTDLDPYDHFLVGHEFYSQGDLERATQEFRRALEANPRHFWTHYFLAICCITAGKPDVAVAHLTTCQSQKPDLIWIYLLRGFALGQMKDQEAAAEKDFSRALELKPNKATLFVLYNNRGVMRFGQKQSRQAGIQDLKEAISLRPDQYQTLASLAEAYRLDGKLDLASRHLEQAISQASKAKAPPAALAVLYHSKARLHLQRSDRDSALGDLATAARLAGAGPLRARMDADRGRVLHLLLRLEEALAAYDQALAADPARAVVHRWRGEVLLVKARYREAAAAFDTYLDSSRAAGRLEEAAAVYRQRGLARSRFGRHAGAIDDYSRALQAERRDAERALLYLSRGQEHLTQGAARPALSDFEEALRLDSRSADARLGCAHVYLKMKEPRRAVAAIDPIIRGNPKEPRLCHAAASVYAHATVQAEALGARTPEQNRPGERAVELLARALALVGPRSRAKYWRDNVSNDTGLDPIRHLASFRKLADRYGR